LSGWACDDGIVGVAIGDRVPYLVPRGSARADTSGICGASHTGFGLLFNFNTLGAGAHMARLYVNGKAGEAVPFSVTVRAIVPDFPAVGKNTTLVWQQSIQNFAIESITP